MGMSALDVLSPVATILEIWRLREKHLCSPFCDRAESRKSLRLQRIYQIALEHVLELLSE